MSVYKTGWKSLVITHKTTLKQGPSTEWSPRKISDFWLQVVFHAFSFLHKVDFCVGVDDKKIQFTG